MNIAYTPDQWNESQAKMHAADSIEEALYLATCLAGGWYRRQVTIDLQIIGDKEHYRIRPSDTPATEGWEPVYALARLGLDSSR
jgi:hypothetical protein